MADVTFYVGAFCVQHKPQVGQGRQYRSEAALRLLQGLSLQSQRHRIALALRDVDEEVRHATIRQALVECQDPTIFQLDFMSARVVDQVQAPCQKFGLSPFRLRVKPVGNATLENVWPDRFLEMDGRTKSLPPDAVAQGDSAFSVRNHDAGMKRLNGLPENQISLSP